MRAGRPGNDGREDVKVKEQLSTFLMGSCLLSCNWIGLSPVDVGSKLRSISHPPQLDKTGMGHLIKNRLDAPYIRVVQRLKGTVNLCG